MRVLVVKTVKDGGEEWWTVACDEVRATVKTVHVDGEALMGVNIAVLDAVKLTLLPPEEAHIETLSALSGDLRALDDSLTFIGEKLTAIHKAIISMEGTVSQLSERLTAIVRRLDDMERILRSM